MSDASRNDLVQNLRVFVSCASDDLAEARAYRTALQAAGFTVHLYDENPYGAEIAALVRAQIAACDYFLFLVSRHSAAANRPWVAQELGHALATRDATGGYRPIVIPVYCADQGSVGRIVDFPVRDFDTSVPRPQPLPLAGLRAHDPHRNPLSDTTLQLIRSLQVEVALVHEDIATADELIDTGAIRLYHELFPDDQRALWEEDRQSIFVEDVDRPFRLSIAASRRLPRLATWLGLRGTFRLKSYFFVLLRRRQAIGFVWVTYNRRSRLLYGNFIGVHEQWRRGSLVNPRIDAVGNRVLRDFPDCLGLILEVEPFALDDVEAAVADIERGSVTPEAINIVRSFKRVWWYETSERLRARCIRDVRTQAPLTHMYPCMETDAPRAEWPSRERPYWLMVCAPHRLENNVMAEQAWTLWRRATDFSVLEYQAKAVALNRPELAGIYWQYAVDLQKRNLRTAWEQTGGDVELARPFGADRSRGGRARELYARISGLPLQIHV